ncbi:MAG: hypothetical protein HRT36_00025 [Alphaproteobacteria bacterium]|nr:hypothetical protein [Alphaproteobacteria bacterium]
MLGQMRQIAGKDNFRFIDNIFEGKGFLKALKEMVAVTRRICEVGSALAVDNKK